MCFVHHAIPTKKGASAACNCYLVHLYPLPIIQFEVFLVWQSIDVYAELRGFCFPCHQTFKCRPSILKPSSHSIHCRPAFSFPVERYTRRFLESVALFGAINVVVYWTFVTSGMIQALMRIIGSFASQLWIVTTLLLLLPDPWAYPTNYCSSLMLF